MNPLYRVEGNTAYTDPSAAGPWSPDMQHGGAPASLVAWAAENIQTREPMRVARITIDLLRPVPIAPLELRGEVLREGRKIQLCSISLLAGGVEVTRASVLKIRAAEPSLPEHVGHEPVEVPGPEAGKSPTLLLGGKSNAFVHGLSLRVVRGGFGQPGPGAVWFRAERPVVAGQALSPLMRAAMTSDFCNGVSSVLDFNQWTFINADLTISLARMPVGEWILLDAQTWLGDQGAGVAFAKLGDERGYFGRAIQSMVIEQRV
jgi:Thioesterase-like superfamily